MVPFQPRSMTPNLEYGPPILVHFDIYYYSTLSDIRLTPQVL